MAKIVIFESNSQHYDRRIEDLQDRLATESNLTMAARKAINENITALQEAQNRDLLGLYDKYCNDMLAMIDKSTEAQVKETEAKYKKIVDTELKEMHELQKQGKPVQSAGISDEDYKKELDKYQRTMFEYLKISWALEKQKEKEIADIQRNARQARFQEIEREVHERYQDDLDRYESNERKKLEILEAAIKEEIEAKSKAGYTAYREESELMNIQAQQRRLNLNKELLEAENNAKKIYEAKKKYLEKEKEMYSDNEDMLLQINRDLADAEQELLYSRIEAFENYASRISEVMSSLNSMMDSRNSAELDNYRRDNSEKEKILKKRLDSGELSQKEYNRRVEKMEEERAKVEARLAREQAVREKSLKTFQIVIDTAAGVAKAIGSSPMTFGLPWSAFVAATGAIQLAAVLSEPLPKAARGKLIKGQSHAYGGTIVEAEGGEAIINKRSVSMFGPLLSAINEAGGGVPFVRPYSDGGFAARNVMYGNQISASDITKAVESSMANLKIYTTIEDIRREDANYVRIQQAGTI